MKRVLSIILLSTLLLSACGGQPETTPPEPVPDPVVSEEKNDTQNEVATESKTENEPENTSENDRISEEDLEELRLQEIKGSAQSILARVAYYGDPAKCEMTAEQAAAYAQLMADGIAGMEFYNEWNEETTIRFWDRGFWVSGYGGPYKTNRASVVLGDFAGDEIGRASCRERV